MREYAIILIFGALVSYLDIQVSEELQDTYNQIIEIGKTIDRYDVIKLQIKI